MLSLCLDFFSFSLLACGPPLAPAPFVEGTASFPLAGLCTHIREQLALRGASLFPGSLLCSIDPSVYFPTPPYSFGLYSFVGGLSLSAMGPLALFFRILSAILGLRPFCVDLRVTTVSTSKFFTCLIELTSFFKAQNVNWQQLGNTSPI